jgi:hypothetical protein
VKWGEKCIRENCFDGEINTQAQVSTVQIPFSFLSCPQRGWSPIKEAELIHVKALKKLLWNE